MDTPSDKEIVDALVQEIKAYARKIAAEREKVLRNERLNDQVRNMTHAAGAWPSFYKWPKEE